MAKKKWNKISAIVALFLDPLFCFLFYLNKDNSISIHQNGAIILFAFRSLTDLNTVLQFLWFRTETLIYVNWAYFLFDFCVVLPLPQILLLSIISSTFYLKDIIVFITIIQYVMRLFSFLPILIKRSKVKFMFESKWKLLVINVFDCILPSHIVGALWYLFSLQRVRHCFHANLANCTYGIYANAVALVTEPKLITKYMYALSWGFRQICTLSCGLAPGYNVGEVLFSICIMGVGLLLFAHIIGNIENFFQAFEKRRLEMQNRVDVEEWMSRHNLPHDLRRRVRQAATRRVNEEMVT